MLKKKVKAVRHIKTQIKHAHKAVPVHHAKPTPVVHRVAAVHPTTVHREPIIKQKAQKLAKLVHLIKTAKSPATKSHLIQELRHEVVEVKQEQKKVELKKEVVDIKHLVHAVKSATNPATKKVLVNKLKQKLHKVEAIKKVVNPHTVKTVAHAVAPHHVGPWCAAT